MYVQEPEVRLRVTYSLSKLTLDEEFSILRLSSDVGSYVV